MQPPLLWEVFAPASPRRQHLGQHGLEGRCGWVSRGHRAVETACVVTASTFNLSPCPSSDRCPTDAAWLEGHRPPQFLWRTSPWDVSERQLSHLRAATTAWLIRALSGMSLMKSGGLLGSWLWRLCNVVDLCVQYWALNSGLCAC